MKTRRIDSAEIDFDHPGHAGLPYSSRFGDIYHARSGAFAQAGHVFLAGNGLPQRWRERTRFVILETGFGLGQNFLATWAAWRADAERCERLYYLAVEAHPPTLEDFRRVHGGGGSVGGEPGLAAALAMHWPASIPGLHSVSLESGRVQLLLAWGDAGDWLPELVATIDAFYLDGFAPRVNAEMWTPTLLKHCARLGAQDATVATWTVARSVRDALTTAGFQVELRPGFDSKREMLSARRRPAAHQGPKTLQPAGRRSAPACRSALVIGAGLAGATAAQALAAQGLAVTVLERGSAAAQEASGNVAGLFHSVVHTADGVHARSLRAAALMAESQYRALFARGKVTGALSGLLRGSEFDGAPTAALASHGRPTSLASMQALLQAQGLPNSHVQALGAEAASVLAGVDLGGAWWHFPGAGWLAPGELVASWLGQRGISTRFNTEVTALEPREGGGWCALGANGEIVAEADVAVVAAASAGSALLAPWSDVLTWPLQSLRGQLTQLSPALVQALALQTPRLPLVAGGYALALPEALGGGLLCGATQHADDDCSFLRAEDHRSNLEVAARLGPALQDPASQAWCVSQLEAAGAGRVGWRQTTADRLPIVGAVPVPSVQLLGQRRLEQPRHVPRVEGLYTLCALGSRGITWAPLLGEVLAAWVTGSPQPIGADLLDAMDPARFLSRQLRRPPAKV